MPKTWLSFAPVEPYWAVPKGLSLPYSFGSSVSIRSIPEWVRVENFADKLRLKLQEKIDDRVKHCIAVEYEAEALGTVDPTWRGAEAQTIQETASDSILSVNVTLWLASPAALSFKVIAHTEQYGRDGVTRQLLNYDPLLAREEAMREKFTVEQFEKARALFEVLETVPAQGTVRTAVRATARALMESAWPLRFLLLWLSVESLFGPEDARGEIAFQLSQRASLFLENDPTKARELFAKIKASYTWRSKIVHGLRLAKLSPQKSYPLLVELEELVRRSLTAVLKTETVAKTFDGGDREEFLDSLPFNRNQS